MSSSQHPFGKICHQKHYKYYSIPHPKWHLDWFGHFCKACDRDRPTDRPRYSLCSSMSHLVYAAMWLIIITSQKSPAARFWLVWIHGGGTFGNWTSRGYANSRIANLWTGHLADSSTRGLDNLRTSQLADWTSRGLDNSRSRRCRQKNEN